MATISDVTVVQGDNKPDLNFTIKDADGVAINITGCTINFYFRKKATVTVINSGHTACTITDAPNGKCKYVWDNHSPVSPVDLAGEGEHEGEVEITYAGGDIQTVPAILKIFVRGQFA